MRVFMFHLMPYQYMDMDYQKRYRAAWVVMPNTEYDPKKGHELYNRYLDELELCAELGFDGIAVNEHHQTAYGMMPSPVVMASALSRRTKDCKIAILGNAFGIREQPLTLAEEHAMIDNITGGRVITGMVRGVGCEYFSFGANPAHSHDRFHEAHDLVVRAWTEPGPFAFEGKHYNFEYVNVWPRPYQQPHPPIWAPSMGSLETIEWASHPSRRYVYLQNYSAVKSVMRYLTMYRDIAQKKWGYTASSEQLGWGAPTYVAETDRKARDEAQVHIESLFNKFLAKTPEMMFPPGYLSASSAANMAQHKKQIRGNVTVDGLIEQGIILCGSPKTVLGKLTEAHKALGFANFLALLQFGTLPRDLTEKNIRLFSSEVMPALQRLTDAEFVGMDLAAAAS